MLQWINPEKRMPTIDGEYVGKVTTLGGIYYLLLDFKKERNCFIKSGGGCLGNSILSWLDEGTEKYDIPYVYHNQVKNVPKFEEYKQNRKIICTI